MLNDKQKEQLRILISQNPSPDYMKHLSSSDEFALSELSSKIPAIKKMLENQKAQLLKQVELIEQRLVVLKD